MRAQMAAAVPLTFDTAPDVLTMREACALLRLDRATVTRMIHDGVIPAMKPAGSGKWLIPRDGIITALHGEGVTADGKI